jgi:hypothetical protein
MTINIVSITFARTMLATRDALIEEWAEGWSNVAEVAQEMKYAVEPGDTEEIESYEQTIREMEAELKILNDEIDRFTTFMTEQGILTGVDQGWAQH